MKIMTSHPGIGPVFGRIILSEKFDIRYFKALKYLISYSGLAPLDNESAGRKKGKIRLNRHCNYYLKYAFVAAANCGHQHPKYRRKYETDVKKQGKMIAKLNLARRIAYYRWNFFINILPTGLFIVSFLNFKHECKKYLTIRGKCIKLCTIDCAF